MVEEASSKLFEYIGFTSQQASYLALITVAFALLFKSFSKNLIDAVATAASKSVSDQFATERQHRIDSHLQLQRQNPTGITTSQGISYTTPAPAPTSGQQTNVPQQSPIQSFSNSSSPPRRT